MFLDKAVSVLVISGGTLTTSWSISNFAYCYGLIFFKTMILLLAGLGDFSVRFREIILESNRIQSANCH